MTSRKSRVAALVTVALLVFLSVGCTREAASDPLASGATATSQAALSSNVTSTPAEFPTAAPTSAIVINPTAAPTTEVAQVTPTPTQPAQPTATPTTPSAAVAATAPPPPGESTYVVKPGDRLFSIGRQFGVNPYSIAQANNIAPPYVIHPGDTLKIPGGGTPVTPLPGGGRIHVVAPGENLFRIALRYGTTVQALAAANNIANVNLIFVGDQLRIP